MSTRSDIIVQRADGSWARIYCHSDGYLSHNGRILADHYAEQAKCDELVALGDISSLAAEIGEKHPFDWYSQHYEATGKWPERESHPFGRMVLAYGRDRGEKDTEASTGASLADVWPSKDSWTEYTYVFGSMPGGPNEPTWYVGDPDMGPASLVRLELALRDPDNFAPQPDVKSPWGVLWHRDETRTA